MPTITHTQRVSLSFSRHKEHGPRIRHPRAAGARPVHTVHFASHDKAAATTLLLLLVHRVDSSVQPARWRNRGGSVEVHTISALEGCASRLAHTVNSLPLVMRARASTPRASV